MTLFEAFAMGVMVTAVPVIVALLLLDLVTGRKLKSRSALRIRRGVPQ